MKTKLERDVIKFHRRFDFPVKSTQINILQLNHRKKMIREEAQELCEALDEGDPVNIAREAIDLLYIVIGTLVMYGISVMPIWRAVHRANMRKLPGLGLRPKKPADWVSPEGEIRRSLGLCRSKNL